MQGQAERPKTPVRVLLVTGGHDHEPSFYSIFEGHDSMKVNVDPHPAAFRHEITGRYDVLVLYDLVQLEDVDESRRKNLQAFVEAGKGVVILHHAVCSYNAWEWWWHDVAGVRYLTKAEDGRSPSSYSHDEKLVIKPARDHAILNGVGTLEMTDETYHGMWMAPSNQVLLTTTNPTSDGPVAWISAYPKSRVVVIQPGHSREAHLHPGYRRLVQNAIFWSAKTT
jgi:type 1 glutamine amidotransferase